MHVEYNALEFIIPSSGKFIVQVFKKCTDKALPALLDCCIIHFPYSYIAKKSYTRKFRNTKAMRMIIFHVMNIFSIYQNNMLYYEFLYQYIAHFCACKEMTMCDNECTKKTRKEEKTRFQ